MTERGELHYTHAPKPEELRAKPTDCHSGDLQVRRICLRRETSRFLTAEAVRNDRKALGALKPPLLSAVPQDYLPVA